MARKLQIKRGQKKDMPQLAEGELGFAIDEKKVYIGTGSENVSVSATTKADVGLVNVDNTSDANKPVSTAVQTALNGKVDKETGKGLSSNDFTAAYKSKLDNAPDNTKQEIDLLKQSIPATVPASGWSSAPTSAGWYENRVDVSAMKAVYNPFLDLVITSAALALDEQAAFGQIVEAETFDGYVVFRALDVPDISINVKFMGV